jgi:hypothetical protein
MYPYLFTTIIMAKGNGKGKLSLPHTSAHVLPNFRRASISCRKSLFAGSTFFCPAVDCPAGWRPARGWTDERVIITDDIRILEHDEGFSRISRRCELRGFPGRERRIVERRFRKERPH